MIKTVIFDIDGTMYDYEGGNRTSLEAVRDYCLTQFSLPDESFWRIHREAQRMVCEKTGYDCAASHNRLIRFQCILERLEKPLFPHALAMYHIYWGTLLDNMKAYDGLLDFMDSLKRRGIGIGVGSNMTAYIQYKKLERLGAAPYVDWILTSEEAGIEKPAPRFFRYCAQKSGHNARECLFIGDSLKGDVEGALACGMEAWLYRPSGEPDNRLRPEEERPYRIVRSFRECVSET